MTYDSGIQPFLLTFDYSSQMEIWKQMFRQRTRKVFMPETIQSLRLRRFSSGNRLTIDDGTQRLNLGISLSEIEREWLYAILAEKYNLDPTPHNG